MNRLARRIIEPAQRWCRTFNQIELLHTRVRELKDTVTKKV